MFGINTLVLSDTTFFFEVFIFGSLSLEGLTCGCKLPLPNFRFSK